MRGGKTFNNVSQLSMGSYGVDTGPKAVKLGNVRDVTKPTQYANASETLGDLDRDLKAKMDGKFDPAREAEVKQWISQVDGKSFGSMSLVQGLKTGVRLCQFINILFPGTVKEINTGSMPFFHRDNISKYLDGCKRLGVNLFDLFDTQDLYDEKNPANVVNHFYALSAFARNSSRTFKGPFIGVKVAVENKRGFTEEQLRKGQFVASAQTQGSYGVLEQKPEVKLSYQIIKNVDQIKDTQQASQNKVKKLYG